MAKSGFELILSYKFIKLMSTNFEKWDAYELGVIDKDGNTLKEAKTREEKKSFSLFHVLVRNIKRILSKLPGGKTRMGSFLAAMYLLKENNEISDIGINTILNEYSISTSDETDVLIEECFLDSDKIILDCNWTINQKYNIVKECYLTDESFMGYIVIEGVSILTNKKVRFIREMIK